MDNLNAVLHQMENFGIELRDVDKDRIASLPGSAHVGKRKTCGKKGKDWFKFYVFRPDMGGAFITGSFGTYRHGGSWEKVEQDWAPLSAAERERQVRERAAAVERAAAAREESKRIAAMRAGELWHFASREGHSPYLARKGLQGEACRYLPDGTLVILMLRYDLPREEAIQAAQSIMPNGEKKYSYGFSKPGCALRLGAVDESTQLVAVVEGYATGLTVRTALDRQIPVYVAFDAGNLYHVLPILRELHPDVRMLICADDDWRTRDPQTGELNNPGRTAAKAIAKQVPGVDIVYPIFDRTRQDSDTDFDDLRLRQGIEAAQRQLQSAVRMMERVHG
jgi:putative DNA primase/helicase